ncbi:PAS domain-containing protein [Ferrovibrio terrae]|nr:PAS domain-containing protein [Ferrovibrio terrae]
MDRPLDSLLADLDLPGHRAVAEHWLALYREAGTVPSLARIDPLHFHRALPDAWIVDLTDDGRFQFRLMGETLVQWYGRTAKGLYYQDLFPADVVPVLEQQSRLVLERPQAGFQRVHTNVPAGTHMPRAFERLTFPLRDKAGDKITHILGNSIFNRAAGDPAPEHEYWYPIP